MISLHHLNRQKALLALSLVSLGLIAAPTQAQAVSMTRLTDESVITNGKNKYDVDGDGDYDDIDFERQMDRYSDNIKGNDGFKELFVAEGRIGNNSLGTGERELGINRDVRDTTLGADGRPIGGKPVTVAPEQSEFVWKNGVLFDFTLEYDGNKVTYILGDDNYILPVSKTTKDPVTGKDKTVIEIYFYETVSR